ncbi:MAG TPA: FAD-dependent oxidoreductase [Planctomycetota bacterium]|nr:FAD-dependent oxidoreductase [Planctomycetota bacterium]
MNELKHDVDFCVIGGGMAGLCAAVAAARHGAEVALVQDRPVLGGNASSEMRMWVCGAHGENNRETGILEELQLENLRRNPLANWSIWDSVLWEAARFQKGLKLFLNTTCTGLEMDGPRIRTVHCRGLTNEKLHAISARLFADCSGDSVLAPMSGAEFRIGREGREEFGEDIAPEAADRKTMGLSLLLTVRERPGPCAFTPPRWARVFESDAELPFRNHDIVKNPTNFWWIELGGEADSIADTEELRDELLAAAFGVWDHIKNRGDHGAANWDLDWVGFLPGKRESRRYLGDHVLTQHDVRAEGRFEDIVAYGGWSMDDHHPAGLRHPGEPTVFHKAPSPYGIPYRSLYSRNVENLFCAGRNISATHAAMSSTRVMATCSLVGQAVGTAAALAADKGLSPRGVGQTSLAELQAALMDDDCWLPWKRREIPEPARSAKLAASAGDPEPLRSGVDRPQGADSNAWTAKPGSWVECRFDRPRRVSEARMVFDSDLNRYRLGMRVNYPLAQTEQHLPPGLVKSFRLELLRAGERHPVVEESGNAQRLVRRSLAGEAEGVRLTVLATHGAPEARVFAFHAL